MAKGNEQAPRFCVFSSCFISFTCIFKLYAACQICKNVGSGKALYLILSTVVITKENLRACRLGPKFEEAVPLRAGEKPIEGEEGVKVVVEKTFWQKYVSFLSDTLPASFVDH